MIAPSIRILLIEDNPSDVGLVEEYLRGSSEVLFVVENVTRLADGIRRLQDEATDVVLLDLSLPDSDGLHTFQAVYHACRGQIAIVVLTGTQDESLGAQIVQLGGQDYFNKQHLTNEKALQRCIRYAYERKRWEVAENQLRLMRREFDAARAIQEHLIPRRAPELPGFDIAGICCPTQATGGDYFDYIPMANGCLGVVIADVSSHGFGPALLMAITKGMLRMLIKTGQSLDTLMPLLNAELCATTQSEHFITLFFACLNPADRTLVYAGAGHNAYLFDVDGKPIHIPSTSMPLGMTQMDVRPCEKPWQLQPGQILLLFTDGFHEAISPDGRLFGLSAVLETVQKHRQRSAQEIVQGLLAAVRKFCSPALTRMM